MVSNPFIAKKLVSKKTLIQNSTTYQERANSKPATENAEPQPAKQRRAKSDRKNQSKLKTRPSLPIVEQNKASVEVFEPTIMRRIDPNLESLTEFEPQTTESDELNQKSVLQPMIMRQDDLHQKSVMEPRIINMDQHQQSLTLSELQNKALQIEKNELEMKQLLDNIVIPSLGSVESANSELTA